MSGSMGFGKIQLFVMELARRLKENEGIVVICGNNQRLERLLHRELSGRRNVRILGYTQYVSDYMDACDVIFTKPGGLTSTEAAVKNISHYTYPADSRLRGEKSEFLPEQGDVPGTPPDAGTVAGRKKADGPGCPAAADGGGPEGQYQSGSADKICRLLERLADAGKEESE